uniref:Raftlin, lipid raft linker 1 n=1 Tax=Rhinolophus ferrumequinum TaxID=59479 RepID=A0A671F2T4_RHIFE
MGCGLNKLEKRDDKRPGNIYSTLKRPQVETKIDVSYEYRFLEFTTLSAAELPRSPAVRLSSLRDLPNQLLELYQQGFLLVALHPFVQPTHEQKTPLEHMFRAILIKKTERSQKTDLHNEGYTLELDCCSSLVHLTDKQIIPEFIKKIQEAASRGLKFVGVIPQYHCPVNSAGSSPLVDTRDVRQEPGRDGDHENPGAPKGVDGSPEPSQGPRGEPPTAEQHSLPLEEGNSAEFSPLGVSKTVDGPDGDPSETHEKPLSGNSLHGLTDGVFIFEAVSTEDSKTTQGYDAIVVEQWTVLEGVEVQTDYVPLLNSLAAYGWQLTCVLPTPVVKTNREGSVSTKQIVFLQRPCLPQKIKKKESKFQWRFSREDMHSRQMRKSKGKLSARDKRQAEENEKNLEEQFSKAGDVGNCVLSRQQEVGASEEMKVPFQEVTGEQLCPDSRLCVEGAAMQNGPAGHCRAPAGGCEGQSGPGEDAREGGAEEVAAEPLTAEDN